MADRIRVLGAVREVPAAAWDALLAPEGPIAWPFTSHAFLDALEQSGCAGVKKGWAPRHLALFRGERLVAAAPAYVRDDSDGDFGRDWDLAAAVSRAGRRWYPKLCLTVPFTPVTGRRLLVAPDADRAAASRALLDGALDLARKEGLGAVQVLFPTPDELPFLAGGGFAPRVSFQYHWTNAGYASMEEFLARFSSKKRNQIRRELRAPGEQGIAIRTVRGEELVAGGPELAREAYRLHKSTVDKLMWGRGWLNEEFYERIFATMPASVELVRAERGGKLVAGAFNVATPTHLYGRYWGCFEEHPFLHFNVCLYHSVAECIALGRRAFEGGAGGEHKLARGFEPAETWSAHLALDARVQRSLAAQLGEETMERRSALRQWRAGSPVLKPMLSEESP